MNSLTIDLDSLTAARAEAYTSFLRGLADAQRGAPSTPKEEIWKDSAKGKAAAGPTAEPAAPGETWAPLAITSAQARDMDETAGLAPSSAPEAQQAGAPAESNVPQPPAPPVPMPPAPPAPAPAGSLAADVELDARGLPWDERIHSTSKGRNGDGTWRARRNMGDERKAQVPGIEAELRASLGQGHLATAETAAPAASASPLPPPAPPVPAPTATAPAGTTAASGSPAPANAVELTLKVTKLGNLLGADELQRACASVGLPDTPQAMLHLFAEAQKDPTLVARLNAEIDEILAS